MFRAKSPAEVFMPTYLLPWLTQPPGSEEMGAFPLTTSWKMLLRPRLPVSNFGNG